MLVAGFHYMYVMNVYVIANVILKSESRSSLSSHPNENEVSYLGLDIFKVKLATVVLDFFFLSGIAARPLLDEKYQLLD